MIITIDLETTGLDPNWNEMCEFGWATDDEAGSFAVFIDQYKTDPEAMKINKFYERAHDQFFSHPRAIEKIGQLITKETIVVCSPSFFDMGFLAAYWRSHSMDPLPWGHRNVIDLKSYACGVMGWDYGVKNSVIAERLGIPDDSDHTAQADAVWTHKLFHALEEKT